MSEFSGSGRGVQTRDGRSVEFYRQLPYMGELDPLQRFLHAGASVLRGLRKRGWVPRAGGKCQLAFSLAGETWRQTFAAVPLEREQIESLLAKERLQVVDAIGLWVVARPR